MYILGLEVLFLQSSVQCFSNVLEISRKRTSRPKIYSDNPFTQNCALPENYMCLLASLENRHQCLRWHGSHSEEVNKNINLGYSQVRVCFRANLLCLILKRVLVAH